jgi:CRISPR-associated protein Cmr5
MRQRIDNFIPKAFRAIKAVKIGDNKFVKKYGNGAEYIPNEYKGYISSLGANIIQSGIRTAILFYEAKPDNSDSKSNRQLVNAAIKFIVENANSEMYEDCKLSAILPENDPEELQRKTEEIMDAATALKLALRTYRMEKL